MFCIKCKYISFDYLPKCPKCGFEWTETRKRMNLDWMIEPVEEDTSTDTELEEEITFDYEEETVQEASGDTASVGSEVGVEEPEPEVEFEGLAMDESSEVQVGDAEAIDFESEEKESVGQEEFELDSDIKASEDEMLKEIEQESVKTEEVFDVTTEVEKEEVEEITPEEVESVLDEITAGEEVKEEEGESSLKTVELRLEEIESEVSTPLIEQKDGQKEAVEEDKEEDKEDDLPLVLDTEEVEGEGEGKEEISPEEDIDDILDIESSESEK